MRRQQSPTFLAPGTGFMEGSFSTAWSGGWFGMTQVHYIYCALYFFYDYISSTSGHPSGIRSQRLGTPDYIIYLKYINSQACMTPTTSSEYFYHHKKIPCAHQQSLPNHPILQLRGNTKLFSVSINLLSCTFHINRVIYHVVLCDWTISLSIMFSQFTHVEACSFLFIAE